MATTKKCSKHEGVNVSFSAKTLRCPVCMKDAEIAILGLAYRQLSAFFLWGLDWIRIASYHGSDRVERERQIEKVYADFQLHRTDLLESVRILEEYSEIRKSYTW